MDWLKAYRNGSFEPEYWYVCLYGKVPNKYEYTVPVELEIDTAKINIDSVRDKFKTINSYRLYNQTVVKSPSEVQKNEDVFDFRFTDSGYLVINADHKVIRVITNCVTIWYDKDKLEDIEKLAKDVFESFEKCEDEPKIDKISLIKVYQGDYYTSKNDIKHTVVNIEENYNDDFKQIYDNTIKFLNDRSSGLILYHGRAGTGKTNMIRHLISTVPKEFIVVPNSVAMRLGDPDLIGFITDHTDSIFILEDCEQLLEDREDNPFNNAIATILNMADGLLSDVCNIKFICTFNADVEKIDPALLRKGRCVAKYEFKELSEEKVKFLNDKYNLGHEEIKPMTLAEVYNAEKPDYLEEKVESKIGF